MTVDASAVARVLGIGTEFKDLRGGRVLFLPQRIAVLAQGSTDAVYSSKKFTAGSATEVGNKAGYGSPAHHIVRQLLPANGDGVGTVPVDVFLLQQAPGSSAATGDITPVGTQTKAASYRVRVGNVYSAPFVIPVGASVSHIIGAMMNAIASVLEMPATALPTYGTVTSQPGTNTGNGTVTAPSVTGTPRPGAYKLTLVTAVADGGVFKLTDPDGNVVSSNVTMTPGPAGATVINTGGLQFTITDGATNFAVGDSFTIIVAATKLSLMSKWKGESANAIRLGVEGDSYGVTFAFTQPTGGLVNPSVGPALAQFGNVWETFVVNALNISDTTALDAIATVGEGRWGDTVRKPFVAFTGNTIADRAEATAISSSRRTDKVNGQLVSPGSEDLPFVVAARQVARIAKVANNNPPVDYGSQRATGLIPGADDVQWDYLNRDLALKAGSSTIEVKDGVVNLSDIVTFYRPTGEDPPGYRYVCDIVKLQNVIFNMALRFERDDWNGAPLIPNDQPTVNRAARKPRAAVAEANAMLDNLGLEAIISDPEVAKKKTTAAISTQNPKRLDVEVEVQLSGNTNIVSTPLSFGFYFGTQTPGV